jgi:hypothetical protein
MFGVLGIFTFGLLFVPLGLLCTLFSFLKGEILLGLVSLAVNVVAIFVSPSVLLVLFGAASLVRNEQPVTESPNQSAASTFRPNASVAVQEEGGSKQGYPASRPEQMKVEARKRLARLESNESIPAATQQSRAQPTLEPQAARTRKTEGQTFSIDLLRRIPRNEKEWPFAEQELVRFSPVTGNALELRVDPDERVRLQRGLGTGNRVLYEHPFIFMRETATEEVLFIIKYGRVTRLGVFSVPAEARLGASQRDGRFGAYEQDITFRGYVGLGNGEKKVTALQFLQLIDDAFIVDGEYTWALPENRTLYVASFAKLQVYLRSLPGARSAFDPDDPTVWDDVLLPAAQCLLIAAIAAKNKESELIYATLYAKFGPTPVEFLKRQVERISIRTRIATSTYAIEKARDLYARKK